MLTRLRCKVVAAVLAVGGLITPAGAATVTIATFADPAQDASTPLCNIDTNTQEITGGWQNGGLDLEFPWHGSVVGDVYFTLTDGLMNNELNYTPTADPNIGITEGGILSFYENQSINPSNLILKITFDTATLTLGGIFATELFGTGAVDITDGGNRIPPLPLDDESFSFSFANQTLLPGGGGYTATASFTSSAVPEPATMGFLVIGLLLIFKGRPVRFSNRNRH